MFYFQYPVGLFGTEPPPGAEDEMKKVMENLEAKLEGKKFLAGETLTLADISVMFNLTWMGVHPSFNMSAYPNFCKWRETIKEMPEYQKVNEGFDGFLKSKQGGD